MSAIRFQGNALDGFSIEEALSLPAKKGNNQILRKKA